MVKLLQPGQITALIGEAGIGKSFLAVDAALRVAMGDLEWLGAEVPEGPVMYVTPDSDASVVRRITAGSRLMIPQITLYASSNGLEYVSTIQAYDGKKFKLVVLDSFDLLADYGAEPGFNYSALTMWALWTFASCGAHVLALVNRKATWADFASSRLGVAADVVLRTAREESGQRYVQVEKMPEGAQMRAMTPYDLVPVPVPITADSSTCIVKYRS